MKHVKVCVQIQIVQYRQETKNKSKKHKSKKKRKKKRKEQRKKTCVQSKSAGKRTGGGGIKEKKGKKIRMNIEYESAIKKKK